MITETPPACHPQWIGIDVGKHSLAIHDATAGTNRTIANTAGAIKPFLQQNPRATLALEATGGYEAEVVALAIEAGHTVYRVNARRVRAFMESKGIHAKTDAIDAQAPADFAVANADRIVPFTLPTPEMKELKHHVRRRDELIAMRTQERNRLQAPDNACFPRDSGKKQGYRRTRGGRVNVRRALYMAALSATRYNKDLKTFYNRLLKNGKKPLQALIASARKLLVILNAKLRDHALKSS